MPSASFGPRRPLTRGSVCRRFDGLATDVYEKCGLVEVLQLGDVGEISVGLVQIEAVPQDKFVGYFKTHIVDMVFGFLSLSLFY